MGPIDVIKILVQWEKIKKNWKPSCMLSIQQLFKSKTFWTLVATGIFNIVHDSIPLIQDNPDLVKVISSALAILAIIFRLNNSAGSK